MADNHIDTVEEVIEDVLGEVVEDKSTSKPKTFSEILSEKQKNSAQSEDDSDNEEESEEEAEEESSDETDEVDEDEKATEDEVADLKFLRDNRERIAQLLELERQLTNKESAPEIFRALASGIAQVTGMSVKQLLGDEEEVDDEEGEFDTGYEEEIYRRAKAAAVKELQKQFTPLQEKLNRLEEAESKRNSQSKLAEQIEQGYGKWTARIEKETGFKPTKSQVEQALKKHPNLEPVEAIKLANLELILKVQAKEATRSAPKAPTIAARSSSIGKSNSSPKSFTDILLAKRQQEGE